MRSDAGERRFQQDELDARARQILRAVVAEYVQTGEPVPSQALARQPGIAMSSASVRAVLNDLEALGFLDKPHSSAGRIPTEKGYRFYANVLVRLSPVTGRDRERIDQQLDPTRALAPQDVRVAGTSRLLHELTRLAGVVSAPRPDESFRAIEFIRLRDDRVLAVCVTGAGSVKNRLLHVEFRVTQDQLDEAGRYLQDLLGDAPTLQQAREALARVLTDDRARADELQQRAVLLGTKVFGEDEAPAPPVVVEGETSLLADNTLAADVGRMRALFRELEEKERLQKLLERTAEARELTLYVGEETGFEGAGGVAVIAAPYGRGGQVLGAIGVVGPARMAYGRVIPIIDYTAKALSRSLDES